MGFFEFLFGKGGGVTHSEFVEEARRSQLSNFLPWEAYDPVLECYMNNDGSIGLLWECTPLSFAGERTVKSIDGLLRAPYPQGTILQFILYGDPDISGKLEQHRATQVRKIPLMEKVNEALLNFFKGGVGGMDALSGIPLREFRLFFSVTMPLSDVLPNILEIKDMAHEALAGARLAPKSADPSRLLLWMRQLFNDGDARASGTHYDDLVSIRKQVIFSETPIVKEDNRLKIGKRFWKSMTPKAFPREVDPIQTNQLFGGIHGVSSDADQVLTPFLYTLNVIVDDQKNKLHTKCNFILQQQGVGSFAPSLARKKDEYLWAVDEIEKGTRFFRVMPIFWVFAEDEGLVTQALTRCRRIWEGFSYVMQEDRGILLPLFIASLPMGLYSSKHNIDTLDRDTICPAETISCIAPVQGDFAGMDAPILLFVGRKGQVIGLDLFGKSSNNHNALVAATSGSGKSFFINYLVSNYYAAGVKIRIIDIGGSYKKMGVMFGAKYLDFSGETQICINPFSTIRETEGEDVTKDLHVIAPIITEMIFSVAGSAPTVSEANLIKNGVSWAYENKGTEAGIDTVYEYLSNVKDRDATATEEICKAGLTLAYNLTSYTSKGPYGRFFNGPSTFDISKDDFVVLELEHLSQNKELFRVITLQIINAVTMDLYLSDRETPRMIILEEAWQFLGDSNALAQVCAAGYRRARKYRGSFTVVTQSILDLKKFGGVGDVIAANSAWKFYLESTDSAKAAAENLISYDPFVMEMLKGIKSRRPRYSELFVNTPGGPGVCRLLVDPYSYFCYTSDGTEINQIEEMVKQGATYDQAIDRMVATRRK